MKMSKLVTILLILFALCLPTITSVAETVEKSGPWADELFFKIYLNPETEYLALKTGDINIMDWELPAEKVADALADPNLATDSSPDLGYYLIDINCQKWPTSDVHFRRALAHLVDKSRIETDILQGFGYKLDSVVPVVLGGWANPDIRIYAYSSELAAAELDLGGFTDTDNDGFRNDPITGENMAEVIFYIRIDDPERKQAGEWLAQELIALGVPVTGATAVERAVCGQAVMEDAAGEWNVYTGGWGIGRDPDHLADLYHSKEFDPDMVGGWRGYNYPGFVNSTFDAVADTLKTASTFEEVKEAAFELQVILAEQVPGIPMYGHIGVKAYSADWTGLVNEVGQGVNSWWSTLNMHPQDVISGGIIEYGIKSDIESLNPLTASWTYTWEVLDKIFESPYTNNPYDLSEDWGWLAESWEIEDWTSPSDVPGTKVTFHFVRNAKWHDGEPFTAEDLKFTYEYLREYNVPRYLSSIQFIEKLVLVDDYTLEVYQNTTSFFAFHYLNGVPVLPQHIWEDVGAGWQDYDPVAEGELIGLGPWKFVEYVPGEYVHLVANRDYFKDPTVLIMEQEIESLEEQLSGAVAAGEEAASDIASLSSQITRLETTTTEMLENNAADIEALESQISTLESEISTLEGGLTSASNIGYASIVIAILVGAVAIFMARRET
jgi:ABC-type transport system substrate-binding protein